MEKLNFLTAGIPLRAKDYKTGFEALTELSLNGLVDGIWSTGFEMY